MPYAEDLSRGCCEQFLWLQGLEDAANQLKMSTKKLIRLASNNTLAELILLRAQPVRANEAGAAPQSSPGQPHWSTASVGTAAHP